VLLGLLGPRLFGWQLHMDSVEQSLPAEAYKAARSMSFFALIPLILRAFASGCAAMTGTEAVSNGVPAFRKPESRNAALTLFAMAVILGGLFIGIYLLANNLHVVLLCRGHKHNATVVDDTI